MIVRRPVLKMTSAKLRNVAEKKDWQNMIIAIAVGTCCNFNVFWTAIIGWISCISLVQKRFVNAES